jgi:hypothetical protein
MKIKATLGIGIVGATRTVIIEIDDEELENMTEDEQREYIDEYVQEWANNDIDIGWEETKCQS